MSNINTNKSANTRKPEISVPESHEEETRFCHCCDREYPLSALAVVEGGFYVCESCQLDNTVACSNCGCLLLLEDNAGSTSIPLCQDCYDDHYNTCVDCGRLIHADDTYYRDRCDDDPYCYDCFSRLERGYGVEDYYYKPDPIFYGNGSRFFGVELEIDEAGESDSNADRIMSIGNRDSDHIYCKHDGSLHDGFEIVTHPMTLDYHMNKMPWADVLREAKSMGYISHQAGTCGLHVHVNRNSLGRNIEEQESCIGRILFFFEKHWDELLKFSRRTQRQLDNWAARYGYKDTPKELLEHVKKGTSKGRYACVNLQNYDTVEFRIFRGTLKLNTLIATLQLVNNICEVAYYLSDYDVQNLSWTSFVKSCKEPELIQYLKEREIYINEPVNSEEEI